MTTDPGSRQPHPESSPGYPGWRIVAACLLLAVFSWGLGFYAQGIYLASLHGLHGWPVSEISRAATLYYLVSALLVVFVGDAVARLGARTFLVCGVVLLGASTVLLGRADSLPQLYGAYLLLAFAWAGTSVVAVSTVIGQWFDEKRGLAISLALNGASLGGILGAPALVALIGWLGFRDALLVAGALAILAIVPLVLVVFPSGRGTRGNVPPIGRGSAGPARRDAIRTPGFWTMTVAFSGALMVQVGFIVHQVAFMEPRLGAELAGLTVSVTAVSATVGRLALGFGIDRLNQRLVSAASFASQALAFLIILTTSSTGLLFFGFALFGFSVGNAITLPSLLVHREFPHASFAAVVGLSTAIMQVTYAFGPTIVGTLRDWSGSYTAPVVVCIAVQLAAAGIVLVGGRSAAR